MKALYAMEWLEYERGWGCRREGVSLHLDKAQADRIIAKEASKRNETKDVPDYYLLPQAPVLIEVSEEEYAKVERFYGNPDNKFIYWR